VYRYWGPKSAVVTDVVRADSTALTRPPTLTGDVDTDLRRLVGTFAVAMTAPNSVALTRASAAESVLGSLLFTAITRAEVPARYADDLVDVILRGRISRSRYPPAMLPTANELGTAPHDQTFDVLGYGSTVTFGGGAHEYPPTGERQSALLGLNSVTTNWIHEDQNWSAGWGGSCGGDSGAPNYFSGTRVIAATTTTGDMVCRSTNVALRLDTASARKFLATQVSYPLP